MSSTEVWAAVSGVGAIVSAAAALLAWREARRTQRPVSWALEPHKPERGHPVTLVVRNTGHSAAKHVKVDLEPSPARRFDPHLTEPVVVDPNGAVQLSYLRALGQADPQTVTVTWRRMFLRKRWSTGI